MFQTFTSPLQWVRQHVEGVRLGKRQPLGPRMTRKISFTLNGQPTQVTVEDERSLLWVLRYDLGLTGTKYGCGEGQCGACTVLVNGEAVRSCVMPVRDVAGQQVITIEGLGSKGRLHPLLQAFLEAHAFQCGYCTPGMILTAYALLLKTPRPGRAEIIAHMDGNLCRCGSHTRIVEAIASAAAAMREETR